MPQLSSSGDNQAVAMAASWLRCHRNDSRERALIPELKSRFVITTKQVVEAIRLSYQEEDNGDPS